MVDFKLVLSALMVYENNFRLLHWLRAGDNFNEDHERLASYYEKCGDFMDEIAEYGIIKGSLPVSAKEANEILSDRETMTFLTIDTNKTYSGQEADEIAYEMFNGLNALYQQQLSNIEDKIIEDLLIEHSRYFYIEGMYKLRQRLQASQPYMVTPQ